MATIGKETTIDARPDDVWAALRDYGAVHERLAPGFVVATTLDGDTRTVTFSTGAVARERLVTVDEDTRRVVYTVVESAIGATHHNASAQVIDEADGRTRFVWITDVLPDALAPRIDALMDQGISAIERTLATTTATTARP